MTHDVLYIVYFTCVLKIMVHVAVFYQDRNEQLIKRLFSSKYTASHKARWFHYFHWSKKLFYDVKLQIHFLPKSYFHT